MANYNINKHDHEFEMLPVAYYKAAEKLTAALGLDLGQSRRHLAVTILTRVKSLSDRALDEEIRWQLRYQLVGPTWNQNCIVTYWMMEIIRAPIIQLIDEGQAREINIRGRLRTRVCDSGDDDEACSICLDNINIYILHGEEEDEDDARINIATLDCGHEYHVGCITKWLLRRNNFCPLCKARALEIELDEDVHDGFLQDLCIDHN